MSPAKNRLKGFSRRQSRRRISPRAKAARWATRMFVQLREPLRMPGTVLAPGTYVFRPLDRGANCNRVQIFNEDQTKLLATLTAALDH
jgi:hypothetical protein